MKRCLCITLGVTLLIIGTLQADIKSQGPKAHDRKVSQSEVSWGKRAKQGYSMKVWMSNYMCMGIEAWDSNVPIENCGITGLGLEYPSGSCIEHLYGAGPRVGGIVNGVKRVTEGYNGNNAEKYFLPERWDTLRDRIWNTSKSDTIWDRNFTRSVLDPRFLSKARSPVDTVGDVLVLPAIYDNQGRLVSPAGGVFPEERIWKRLKKPVNRKGVDDDGDGKIDEDELDGLDNDGDWSRDRVTGQLVYDSRGFLIDDVGADGIPDWLEVGCKGPYDSLRNPDPAYDNFEGATTAKRDSCHPVSGVFPRKNNPDRYTENNRIPDHGEPNVDEDYGATSDNDLYCAARDDFRSVSNPEHFPMGVKVFMKSYAWSATFAEGVIPLDYFFINVGTNVIRDAFIGFFADMDVGPVTVGQYYTHDFACYIDSLRTGYIHSADLAGTTPLGLTMLGVKRGGVPIPLTSLRYVWQWHEFQDPCGRFDDEQLYDCMSCIAFGGVDCIRPCQSPDAPLDTRFTWAFGPFAEFRPGDTLQISVALVGGEGVADGPNNLVENARKALALYESGFAQPVIPPSPRLQVEQGFKKVTLRWGPNLGGQNPRETWADSNKVVEWFFDSTHWRRTNPPTGEQHTRGGKIFEGYRVYRSEDPSNEPSLKSFTLLRQYDEPDQFEYNTSPDSGSFETLMSFVDTNLFRGKRYWYAVTSFSLPNGSITLDGDTLYTPSVESAIFENRTVVDLYFDPSTESDKVLVVPNPYRVDHDYTFESGGWEGRANIWTEERRLVKFIHLPTKCTIRIFTLVGDLVKTIEHDNPEKGEEDWHLLSEDNRALASGIYIYTVESEFGKQIGKFVLIR